MNPTPRTLERINYLLDPSTLDTLLDTFQALGMPMGSDRWAEHCTCLLKQLAEEECLRRKISLMLAQAQTLTERSDSHLWQRKRHTLTEDHQRRAAIRGGETNSEMKGP